MSKKIFFVALVLMTSFAIQTQAAEAAKDHLIITNFDKTERANALSSLGKLVFSTDSLFLISNQGVTLANEAIKNVRKISFGPGSATNTETISSNSLYVYPNPTQDVIIVNGAKDGETVRIFDMKGGMLKQAKISGETKIDVASLATGNYVLQIGTQILKFIKK